MLDFSSLAQSLNACKKNFWKTLPLPIPLLSYKVTPEFGKFFTTIEIAVFQSIIEIRRNFILTGEL